MVYSVPGCVGMCLPCSDLKDERIVLQHKRLNAITHIHEEKGGARLDQGKVSIFCQELDINVCLGTQNHGAVTDKMTFLSFRGCCWWDAARRKLRTYCCTSVRTTILYRTRTKKRRQETIPTQLAMAFPIGQLHLVSVTYHAISRNTLVGPETGRNLKTKRVERLIRNEAVYSGYDVVQAEQMRT